MGAPGHGVRANAEKSDRAFRTISEVSTELGVPQHVLRFWETRFGQDKPMKRNGGRRLYRPDHLALLRGIRALLYDDGLTIKGVQKILREQGVKAVVARGEAPEGGGLTLPADTPERLAALRARVADGPGPCADAETAGCAADALADLDPLRGSILRLERVLKKLETR